MMSKEPPMRELLKPQMTTALEIAVLVKCLPDIKAAADLIQQYANTVAAGARIEATQEVYDKVELRLRAAIDAPLVADPQFENDLEKVAEEMSR